MLALTYYAKFDAVWLGILREILTIPIILGAFILLVLSVIAWRSDRFSLRSYAFYAILLIVVTHALLFIF